MKQLYIKISIMLLAATNLAAQQYNDYVGAGHNVGITVTASSSEAGAGPEKTMDASGMESNYFAAGRFLNQATMGANRAQIDELYTTYDNNFEAWIDDQLALPPSYLSQEMADIWDTIYTVKTNLGAQPQDIFGPWTVHFNYAWWQINTTNDDKLRHKLAHSLSQILVVSSQSDLNDHAEALTYYYDLLLEHSFGNYKDLLLDVTYSLPMGYYLSHLNNPKAFDDIRPDENYAREIMQLFTIGLFELNQDGSRKLDANGEFIPTYGQDEIREFAQVFTGLGPSGTMEGVWWITEPFFGQDFYSSQKDTNMVMYDNFHDTSEKVLLGGYTLPAGQSGLVDIEMAVDHLFNHPNVGPFVGRQLIQRLVKSNPTPEYISRVAAAFNDNGSGVRGDMKAVVKAILLDEEARSGEDMLDVSNGRLREPMLRATNYAYAFELTNRNGYYWNNGFDELWNMGQSVLSAPTVFNFYPPDFSPNGEVKQIGLVAPEFKLHNTAKAVTSLNKYFWVNFGWSPREHVVGGSWEHSNNPEDFPVFSDYNDVIIKMDVDHLYDLSDDPELLINELDRVMTFGQLTDETREVLRNTILQMDFPWDLDEQARYRVGYALYLIQISPEYNVIK